MAIAPFWEIAAPGDVPVMMVDPEDVCLLSTRRDPILMRGPASPL